MPLKQEGLRMRRVPVATEEQRSDDDSVVMRRGRGRGRGRGTVATNGPVRREICEMERLANKLCSCVYGTARLERERRLEVDDALDDGRSDPLDRQWIVLRVYNGDIGTESTQAVWRSVREKLEALCVLSALGSTRIFSWRQNRVFWHRVFESEGRSSQRERPCLDALPAPRDDALVPSFLLDFSFLEVSADLVTLVRHALMGNVKSMRVSFLRAMKSLATIRARASNPPTVRLALRFARCRLTAPDIVDRITGIVRDLHEGFRDPTRCVTKTTIKTFRFQVTELDFGGVILSSRDLLSLRKLRLPSQQPHLRIVLDKSIDTSGNFVIDFAEVIRTWFKPQSPVMDAVELEPEDNVCAEASSSSVSDVSLDWSALSHFHLAALFSAMHFSGSNRIRTLSLRGAFQFCDSRVAWAWLAFSVWSKNSSVRLCAIDLSNNSLNRADVAAIASVCEHRSVRAVWEMTRKRHSSVRWKKGGRKDSMMDGSQPVRVVEDSRCEPTWVLVKQGSQLRLQNTATGKDPAFCLASDTFGQLMHEESGTTAILLPGYGVMWVDSIAITPYSSLISSSPRANCGIEELRMNAMRIPEGEVPSSVIEQLFTCLTIRPLKRLDLNGNRLSSEALRAVLAACPMLKSLNIEECELHTIIPLVQAYEDSSCCIETINLARNQIGGRDISALCRLMVRSASPASRLRVLNLYANPIGRVGLHCLSQAIRECQLLTWLVLDRTQDPDSQFRSAFYPFEYQSLGVQPLSPSHEHAFHAVLLTKLRTHMLDASIVQRIHEYAAPHVRRRVLWA